MYRPSSALAHATYRKIVQIYGGRRHIMPWLSHSQPACSIELQAFCYRLPLARYVGLNRDRRRERPAPGTTTTFRTHTTMMGLGREAALRQGIALEAVTVGYNTLEGLVAIAAGIAAGSVALTGFGIDSVIEVTSGALLWWRLRAELGLAPLGPTVERRAARGAGFLLLALGVYIVTDSVRVLVTGRRPESSLIGIVLTALSLIAMPLLARGKLRVAASLGSRALRADAHESIVCAWLSATTLFGLGLNAVLGWWWADPVAALAMLPLIVREGVEAWRGGGVPPRAAGC